MINYKKYNKDSFEFLEKVINSKKSLTSSQSTEILDSLKNIFLEFDNHSNKKTLHLIKKETCLKNEDQIKNFYKYNSSPIKRFHEEVTNLGNSRHITTCQYCTIDSISSIDHYAPKALFPEFSVHPKNLMPSCSICNSKKSNKWTNEQSLIFINLYTDILPEAQYLFSDIKIKNKTKLDIKFKITNHNNLIEEKQFKIIQSHYKELNLIDRFQKASHNPAVDFIVSMNSSKEEGMNFDTFKRIALRNIEQSKTIYGHNYFVNSIKLELIKNSEIFDISHLLIPTRQSLKHIYYDKT